MTFPELSKLTNLPARAAAAFARGAADTFTLPLPALGEVRTLRVWTDGHGVPWHLNFISVAQKGEAGPGLLAGLMHAGSPWALQAARPHQVLAKQGLRTPAPQAAPLGTSRSWAGWAAAAPAARLPVPPYPPRRMTPARASRHTR